MVTCDAFNKFQYLTVASICVITYNKARWLTHFKIPYFRPGPGCLNFPPKSRLATAMATNSSPKMMDKVFDILQKHGCKSSHDTSSEAGREKHNSTFSLFEMVAEKTSKLRRQLQLNLQDMFTSQFVKYIDKLSLTMVF